MSDSTQPEASAKVAALVYNPIKVDLDAIKAVVAAEEKAAGWGETLYFETSVEDPGQGATKRALEAGADMVIVAGGDGTVRAAAEAIHDSDAALALLPSGTGNLLARNLDLTLDDLEHSIHSAFTGRDREIDLGMIDIRSGESATTSHVFLVMAGLGLDAKMLANTDEELKKKVGWLAYVGAIFKALTDKNELRVRYKLDSGRVKNVRAHTIIVGNCGSLQANVLLLPEAAVDDGEFDILILRPENPFHWVQILFKIIWENGVLMRTKLGRKMPMKDVTALNYVKGKELTLKLSRAEEIELDGDGMGTAVAVKVRIKPGGLTVRVPQDA
ncbi:diacylglycerol kinase [Mycetocola manganoxydans]|uniref:Diacylglycerol kinase n=1 Tax=Mycetocola manganoxydans TaxID=699879 RepID=A0A3L7A244_9MICO|nr:diacylglycerol kinase family protein [Mycetocola manganoxydans]RLP73452.1 diacylglycerol kinase [Mycetocola manganoxydans]GHD41646.1 sphingosine kinase [Mycetocola manganoxydans]